LAREWRCESWLSLAADHKLELTSKLGGR
jgi:hypothetical protein